MKVIKLQPDQISLFWDLIKHGVIQAYRIPKDLQQDFTNRYLYNLLLGMYQAWIGFTGEGDDKKMVALMCTRIMDEREYGIRALAIIGVYGFRLIPEEMHKAVMDLVEDFARANGCNVIVTEYNVKRVGDMLKGVGFEEHITIMRKVLT